MKQGVLPLTFADPADYDRIQETDRFSLTSLSGVSLPASPSRPSFTMPDGPQETIELHHTLNQEQIEWFKAGSALNTLRS